MEGGTGLFASCDLEQKARGGSSFEMQKREEKEDSERAEELHARSMNIREVTGIRDRISDGNRAEVPWKPRSNISLSAGEVARYNPKGWNSL